MGERKKPVPHELDLQDQVRAWNEFFGEERVSERAVQDAQEVVGGLKQVGFQHLAVLVAPNRDFPRDASFPGWKVKPNSWFYDQARAGRIAGEPTRIIGGIHIFDTTPKPDYTNGTQMYDDPVKYQRLLADLRRQEAIEVTDWTRHVPETSRAGVSADEYEDRVFPTLMAQIGMNGLVAEGRVIARLPKVIETNIYGNLVAQHIGETTGWEWNHDKFGRDDRLVGGGSDCGGLGDVGRYWSGSRGDDIAGRVLIEIPS